MLIRPIRPDDNVKKLSLGDAEFTPLKTFLRKNAVAYEAQNLARTYVLVDHPKKGAQVWGYVTLVASEVQTTDQVRPPDSVHWPDGYSVPSIKLARMAVDERLRGLGYGARLVDWALAVAQSVAQQVGCRLLVTDAKKSAVKFYERAGFTILEGPDNLASANPAMFIELPKL